MPILAFSPNDVISISYIIPAITGFNSPKPLPIPFGFLRKLPPSIPAIRIRTQITIASVGRDEDGGFGLTGHFS
jgi:hypothetical protein